MQSHLEQGEGWNEVQDFWNSVSGLLQKDGWTTSDRYDDAVALFAELRKIDWRDMVGKERD